MVWSMDLFYVNNKNQGKEQRTTNTLQERTDLQHSIGFIVNLLSVIIIITIKNINITYIPAKTNNNNNNFL